MICSDETKYFANIIYDNIRHISFDELFNKIRTLCTEILDIIKEKNIKIIIFYVSGILTKSNT